MDDGLGHRRRAGSCRSAVVCGSQDLDRLCVFALQVSPMENAYKFGTQQLHAKNSVCRRLRLYPSASDSSPDRPHRRRGGLVVIVRCAGTDRGLETVTGSGTVVYRRRT